MKRQKLFEVGGYSNGTLRSVDIADSIVWEARKVKLSRRERNTVRRMAMLSRRVDSGYATEDEAEELDYIINEYVPNIIDAHAPDYTYYGSLEGDGACIGLLPCVESVLEDMRCGGIIAYEDDRSDYRGYVCDVNDHGNMTLYRRTSDKTLREVWSIV